MTSVRKITHYFLESGHSQNKGDSVHAVIDRTICKLTVFFPEQYYGIVQEAKKKGNKYAVKEIHHTDFLDFKAFALHKDLNIQWKKDIQGKKVWWSHINVIEVDSSRQYIIYEKCL